MLKALKTLKEIMVRKREWKIDSYCWRIQWAWYRALFDEPEAIWWRTVHGEPSADICERCKKPHPGEAGRVKLCVA